MKKYKELAYAMLAIVALMFLIGIAGRSDYYEYVSTHLPRKTYEEISRKIGSTNGDEVAKYYLDNYEKKNVR
jgi:hypothetical protein